MLAHCLRCAFITLHPTKSDTLGHFNKFLWSYDGQSLVSSSSRAGGWQQCRPYVCQKHGHSKPPRGYDLFGHSRSLDVNTSLAHLSFVPQGMWRHTVADNPMFTRFVQPLLLHSGVRWGSWSLWNCAVKGHAKTREPGHWRYICFSIDILYSFGKHCDSSVPLDPQLVKAELELHKHMLIFHQPCLSKQDALLVLHQCSSFDSMKCTPFFGFGFIWPSRW